VGKIMLFRRSDFLAAGGWDAISHTVGEDNALAKAMARIGKRTAFSHRPVRQELGSRAFQDVFQRQLRWSVVRRNDELVSFLAEPICQALPAFAAGALAAPLVGLAPFSGFVASLALWFSLETLLSMAKGWQLSWFSLETLLSMAKGWQLSYAAPAVFIVREAVMFAVWVNAWMTDRVVWARDKVYARVSPDAPPTPYEEEG
jgi:ceramide glucosyltransferase